MFDYTCKKCGVAFQSRKKGKQYCSHGCFAKRFDPVIKTCEVCNIAFTVAYRFREQRSCGFECAKSLISRTLTTREKKACLACGNEFEVVQSYKEKSKYCSYQCFLSTRKSRQPDVSKECEHCKGVFSVPFVRSTQRFCGYVCSNSGENNAMFGKPGPMTGKSAWSRGLTAFEDSRLRALGEKISVIIADKMVSGSWSPPSTVFKGEHYVGAKNSGKIAYLRSSYESAYARQLDENPKVLSWEHEPLRIPYVFEGRIHNYVPDFLVVHVDMIFLVEIKPDSLVDMPLNAAKHRAAREWCALNSISWLVVSENQLMM